MCDLQYSNMYRLCPGFRAEPVMYAWYFRRGRPKRRKNAEENMIISISVGVKHRKRIRGYCARVGGAQNAPNPPQSWSVRPSVQLRVDNSIANFLINQC